MLGTVHDDYNSCDSLQAILDEKKPKAVILGDIAHTDLEFF